MKKLIWLILFVPALGFADQLRCGNFQPMGSGKYLGPDENKVERFQINERTTVLFSFAHCEVWLGVD